MAASTNDLSAKKRVLWIPHTSWAQCAAQRQWFLIHGLKDRFEQHVLTWSARPPKSNRSFYLNPANHLRALATSTRKDDAGFIHDSGVPLPVLQAMTKGYPSNRVLALAQWRFQRAIRTLHRKWHFDALVIAASHHFTGYPPEMSGVPIVFDYVDGSPPEVEKQYIARADRVVSVSHFLQDRVTSLYNRDCACVPNGLNLARIRGGDRAKGRAKWGLNGKRVVSLVGLTCSDRLYFLDALAALKNEIPNLMFVAAGGGAIATAIEAKVRRLNVPSIMTGWLDYADIPDLYAASDVGLYPGDDTFYFDGACPLKVLEYAGASVPTVVNQSAELRRLNFPSMLIRPATVDGFTDGIREAFGHPRVQTPHIDSFDWPILTRQFGDEIDRAIDGPTRTPVPPISTQ